MIRLTPKQAARLMTGKRPARKKPPELVASSFDIIAGVPTLTIPIVVASVANTREHWARASGRKGSQRKTIQKALAEHARSLLPMLERHHCDGVPLRVTLTRLAPGTLDIANLWSGMKGPEDAIAEWFGANDRPPLWLCECRQEKSKAYGLRVEIAAGQGRVE